MLNRWERPVRYRIAGPATAGQRAILERQLTELARLTGLDIAGGEPANLILHTGERPAAADLSTGFPALGGSALSALGRARCFFLFEAEGGLIAKAMIFIPASLDDRAFRHCSVEETAQAMGLPADEGPKGSIFHEDATALELAPIDRLLLRALYAPELRAGMPREEATAAARSAIIRLLKE